MTSIDPIAVIKKNAREEIRVSLTQFKGHDLADARIFADNGTEYIPTRKGLTFAVKLLPELIAALREAEAEARRRGLITDQGATA